MSILRRRFADLEELNEWLEAECRNHAVTARHPEFKDRTVDEVFAEEKSHLLSLPTSPFDGYQESVTGVSSLRPGSLPAPSPTRRRECMPQARTGSARQGSGSVG